MVAESAGLRLHTEASEPWYVTLARGYWLRAKRVSFKTVHGERAEGTAPVGIGNGKTALPTTYRAVGETCPGSCPRLIDRTCFGFGGRPAISSGRDREAGSTREAAIKSAALAIGTAGAMVNSRGRPIFARIHGVGDFGGPDGRVDLIYVRAVAEICREISRLSGRPKVAFGYTHYVSPRRGGDVPRWVRELRDAGLVLRVSDYGGTLGSIVVPTHAPEHMANVDGFACPEQTHGTTCAECGACVNSDRAVVFAAMGLSQARLRGNLSNNG